MQLYCTVAFNICSEFQIRTYMNQNEITLFQKAGLKASDNFNYSESSNAFIGNGYTSLAGNTYFNELRLIEGLLIKEDVGQGCLYTFLNGIRIFDLRTKNLLCERIYHNQMHSVVFVKSEIKSLLYQLITSADIIDGRKFIESEMKVNIDRIVDDAFKEIKEKYYLNKFRNLNTYINGRK